MRSFQVDVADEAAVKACCGLIAPDAAILSAGRALGRPLIGPEALTGQELRETMQTNFLGSALGSRSRLKAKARHRTAPKRPVEEAVLGGKALECFIIIGSQGGWNPEVPGSRSISCRIS